MIARVTMTKETKRNVEEKAIHACADYLRSIGWEPLVAGFQGIEKEGSLRYNFRLILGFTVKKKEVKKKEVKNYPPPDPSGKEIKEYEKDKINTK